VLAGVCATLRTIFRPLIGFKVTIKRDDSPKYALQKALVVTRTSTILNSVVEVNIGHSHYPYKDFLGPYKVPQLLAPTIFTLVNAIPTMQQLHTIQLNSIILSRIHLHIILSAPYPVHLILTTVQLPKMSLFPPTNLRKLTLTMRSSWETVQPLIAHLATSLEYLELKWCEFLPPSQLQLPSFPCLQELRHHQHRMWSTFPDNGQVNELLRLGSQITRLHVTGHFHNEPATACQENLQYLTTSLWMLSEHIFGTEPFRRLVHLSLMPFECVDVANHPVTPSSFIHDHFPTITSLQLSIQWDFRNHAMVMARSQHNLQTLELVIHTREGMDDEESGAVDRDFSGEVPSDQLDQAMLPAALQTLHLEVVHSHDESEQSAVRCIQWVFDDIVPPVTGLGGTSLKSIRLSVSEPEREREPVISRQWVKAPNGDWLRLE